MRKGVNKIIKFTVDNDLFRKIYYVSRLSKYIRLTVFNTIENFIEFLQTTVDNGRFDITKLTKNIFSMMNINNSIIYKQIAKQTFEPFKQTSYWENLFNITIDKNDHVTYTISTIKIPSFAVMLQFILEIRNLTESKHNRENLIHLYHFYHEHSF